MLSVDSSTMSSSTELPSPVNAEIEIPLELLACDERLPLRTLEDSEKILEAWKTLKHRRRALGTSRKTQETLRTLEDSAMRSPRRRLTLSSTSEGQLDTLHEEDLTVSSTSSSSTSSQSSSPGDEDWAAACCSPRYCDATYIPHPSRRDKTENQFSEILVYLICDSSNTNFELLVAF